MKGVILFLLFGAVQADLPIHCLQSQMIGNWKIAVGDNNGNDNTITCGHHIPDRVMTMPDAKISPSNPGFTIQSHHMVELQDPNIAVSAANKVKGTWTMIYDEGFELVLDGKKYFTFFRYEAKGPNPSEESVSDFTSFCHETVSGWYHDMQNNKWGCFVASKIGANEKVPEETKPVSNNDPSQPTPWMVSPTALKPCDKGTDAGNDAELGCDKSNQGTYYPKFKSRFRGAQQFSLAHTNAGMIPRRSALLRPRYRFAETGTSVSSGMTTVSEQSALDNDALFVSNINFIEMINNDAQSTWSARAHQQFEGKTNGHMAALLGRHRFAHPAKKQRRSPAPPAKKGSLPESLDWRTVEGGKYMTPVINQGGCGSCFAVSTADVASMRLRIQTKGKVDTILSPENVVSCSVTNQGCAGGYPFLVAKHGQEMGFVPEACQPYTGGDSNCNSHCYRQKVYRAKNYRYIGGYYGGCNEHAMMVELQNGPIVTALNAPGDLFYYHEGIFTGPHKKSSGDTDFHGMSRWEKTNHAVVVTGYGQEEKDGETIKYWWIKNSWAKTWGMDGFFKMLRGVDAIAVESMAVSFDMDV